MASVAASTLAPSPIIRPASLADIQVLLYLEEVGFTGDRFTAERYRYLLTHANATSLLADHAGRGVGAAVMCWRSGSVVGRLYNIVVDPGYQGGGVGSLLLTACEQEALLRGCRRINLEVRPDNASAITFYQRRGFQAISKKEDFYSDGSPALAMSKLLPPAGVTLVAPR